ncbi:hypothetical protein [Candidatus Magnetobacterium casense]|uniref:Secreted protein n=1 Tax=Candidatus Magnetobacterium casense TaxID=1455061 RepID=A0ABS6S258_9BACT|nr:hypothetical protein [Candidatus Magnetobacterium casensis]MBV6342891.1 hypothetical protein [Candidatus Magnetobacterium casensis]
MKTVVIIVLTILLLPMMLNTDMGLEAQTVVLQSSDVTIPTLQQVTDKGNITTNPIQFTNTTEYIGSDNAGDLDIYADGTIDLHAPLVLTAGSPAANESPLVFLQGPLLTVPHAGAMEFDGTGIYLTPTNHRRFISLASDSVITTNTATTVATTVLWSGVLNADELRAHRVYEIKACGTYTTHDAADTANLSVNVNGTSLITITTPAGVVTDDPWSIDAWFTVRSIGAAGTVSGYAQVISSAGITQSVNEEVHVDTTAINTISIQCAWSDTPNELYLTQAWLAEAD